MSPRKKSKPNPQAPADQGTPEPAPPPETGPLNPLQNTSNPAETSQNAASNTPVAEPSNITRPSSTPAASGPPTLNKKASRKWLGGGGSWRSKAPAVAKIAKESIGVAGGATSELPGKEAQKPQDESPKKFLTKRKSSKGSAIPAAMTKLNVSSDGSLGEAQESSAESTEPTPSIDEPPLPPDPTRTKKPNEAASTFGWRSWWSRPDGHPDSNITNDAQTTPLPGPTPSEESDAKSKELGNPATPADLLQDEDTEMKDAPTIGAEDEQDTEMKDVPTQDKTAGRIVSSASWFWSWSSAQNARTNPAVEPSKAEDTVQQADSTTEPTPEVGSAQGQLQPDSTTEPVPEVRSVQGQPQAAAESPEAPKTTKTVSKGSDKSSGWAFWFKDKPKGDGRANDGRRNSIQRVGEVAVSDTPSQSNPEAAQFNEQEDQPKDVAKDPPKPLEEEQAPKKSFRSLRGRPKSKASSKNTPTLTPNSSQINTPSKTSPTSSPTRPDTAPAAQTVTKPPMKVKQEPPNLILPEFKSTYRMVQKPSYWQQIRQYFLGDENAMPHLHINPSPPRIKKAIAIGVHGYFPAPIFQRVLGQPQGTSIRFANAAAAAIKDWTAARGYSPEIEQIALEGEGAIAERVNTLWKLLLNWIDHIKEADFILVACHSQGVPVAIMLVAKLIQFGCVNSARIGICAMAGVNMGPFTDYKTRYLGTVASELFEFGNPKSLVSQMYLAGLDEALRAGVRIFYVGSIDDQLVSLESSTFSTISHPYIYRAVFVDGRIHAPDFLTHLVGFALKLRNLGLPDHGLVRELSPALAGSLYAGEGHSRVYEDPRIYDLAIQHALETTSLPTLLKEQPKRQGTSGSIMKGINIPVPGAKVDHGDKYAMRVKDYEATTAANNPYYLPWAMRGLLEEDFVRRELGQEVGDLLGMFEDWKPVSKGLKDVKFRLEAVKSRL